MDNKELGHMLLSFPDDPIVIKAPESGDMRELPTTDFSVEFGDVLYPDDNRLDRWFFNKAEFLHALEDDIEEHNPELDRDEITECAKLQYTVVVKRWHRAIIITPRG